MAGLRPDGAEWFARRIRRSGEGADGIALALEVAELAMLQCRHHAGISVNPSFCLAEAEECEAAAAGAADEHLRQEWLSLADDWRQTAALDPVRRTPDLPTK